MRLERGGGVGDEVDLREVWGIMAGCCGAMRAESKRDRM